VVACEVANVGKCAADEVVQCYIAPAQPDPGQPRIRLAAFARVTLKAKAKRRVRLVLGAEAFRVFSPDGAASIPSGPWIVSVAGNQPGGERWGGSAAVQTTVRLDG
jgi:beta-glucosidase